MKIFALRGFYQSTISQIAKEAGVADGTIYLYFKNKDDIMVQFFTYKTRQVFNNFREEVQRADNAVDKLRNLIQRQLTEFQRDQNMALVYQSAQLQCKDLIDDQIMEISKMYLGIIAEIIEQGQEEGCIRKDIYTGLVKRVIPGAIDAVINTWLHAGGNYDLVSMTEPLMDLFIRGIGSPVENNINP